MTLAHVAGYATVEADPDEAHVSLRVSVVSDTGAEDAYRRFSVALARARALLDREGVEHWADAPESWTEREGNNQERCLCAGRVRVKITDLSQVGPLAAECLANPNINVSGLRWDVSARRDLARQARVAAISSARAVADDYAAALGKQVDDVESVSDTGIREAGGLAYAASLDSATEGLSGLPDLELTPPRPLTIEGAVNVTFRLLPTDT
jgi:uncharacterized protein YggE